MIFAPLYGVWFWRFCFKEFLLFASFFCLHYYNLLLSSPWWDFWVEGEGGGEQGLECMMAEGNEDEYKGLELAQNKSVKLYTSSNRHEEPYIDRSVQFTY